MATTLSLPEGQMPVIGLGTWTIFGEQGNPDQVQRAVEAAIDAGYRHFDCAWNYGTEASIGRALQGKITAGVVKREDLHITTKLWDTHHNPKMVMTALKDSLKKLQTSYVDLYLIHWPTALKTEMGDLETIVPKDEAGNVLWDWYPLEDVWKAVEECKKAGLAKNIGVSNFNSKQLTKILNCCTIKPSNMQIEISPYLSNSKLVQFCKERGLTVTAYAPLGASTRPWKEASEPSPFEEASLKEIATAKGKSIAQVILRFHVQNGMAVIPKSITPSRIQENIQIFDFALSEDEMKKIRALNRDLRVYKEPIAIGHKEYPFDEPF